MMDDFAWFYFNSSPKKKKKSVFYFLLDGVGEGANFESLSLSLCVCVCVERLAVPLQLPSIMSPAECLCLSAIRVSCL
jgi:hypothetical protein